MSAHGPKDLLHDLLHDDTGCAMYADVTAWRTVLRAVIVPRMDHGPTCHHYVMLGT